MTDRLRFDPESGVFVLSVEDVEEEDFIDEEDEFYASNEASDQDFDDIPGVNEPHPPETFYVLSQNVRNTPSGGAVVDLVIQIDDDADAREYEVRVTS